MNRVQLIGVLVLPVKLRRDRSTGRTIGKALLAVSDEVRGTYFVPLTLHGDEAVAASKYLGEGSRVDVHGHIHSALLTDHDSHGAIRPAGICT